MMLDNQQSPLEFAVPPDEDEGKHSKAGDEKASDSTGVTEHVLDLSDLKVAVSIIFDILPGVRAVHSPWHRPRKKRQVPS